MDSPLSPQHELPLDPQALSVTGRFAASPIDLERILAAWSNATEKLQQTHHTLRAEVKRLTDELEIKNRELARKNRLADLGQMASHIAHEVRNSLMPMTLYSSLLRRRLAADNGGTEIIDKLDSGLKALDATVNDLLHFTREREPQYANFPIRDLVEEVCASLAPQCAAQAIDVRIGLTHELLAPADREMLRRVLLNLVLNALDAMPDGGRLNVSGQMTSGGLELVVSDSGPGISPHDQDQLFEPFFTTKETGTGLGLAIVERIISAHGGAIEVSNVKPHGAAFCLKLPPPAAARDQRHNPHPSNASFPILPPGHSQRKAAA